MEWKGVGPQLRFGKTASVFALVTLTWVALTGRAQAQDLLQQALDSFPRATFHLEYSRPAQLRRLHGYAQLRVRYISPQLKELETSLQELGIQETNVDELVLGWSERAGNMMNFYGLANGRFDAQAASEQAADHHLAPREIEGHAVYCFKPEANSTCVVLLSDSEGLFGPRDLLGTLLAPHTQGKPETLGSNSTFTGWLAEVQKDAPIWGVATGNGLIDWIRDWMPGQKNLRLNWSQVFGKVQALTYTIRVQEKAKLSVRLDCTAPQAALNLSQILDGVRFFQELSWKKEHPNTPNPFGSAEVKANGRQVNLDLVTDIAGLQNE